MTPLRARLHRIETVDVARLVAGALNAVLRAADPGEEEDAVRQTEWWERALGGPLEDLARQIDTLRADAGYRAALLAFSAAQQWRARSLGYLHRAIGENSQRDYQRWGWSARAYRSAVERFVAEQARRAAVAAARPRLEADAAGVPLRRHPVHAAHFAALWERFTGAAERSGTEQEHAVQRARDLLDAVAERERERAVVLHQRNALRRSARDGIRDDPAAGAATLRGQIRAYERALRERELAEARENAAALAEKAAVQLNAAFPTRPSEAFAGYEGEPALLLRLAGTLPPPSAAPPGHPLPDDQATPSPEQE